ncbi:MAG: ABC transporter permease [Bacillota bacterium]|nr:ABC transporter permease [Bacillota bacterium]
MSVSTITDFLCSMIRTATPIALGTLACTFSERAGVINIGIEGIMIISAFTGAATSFITKNPWLGALAGMTVGVLMSALIVILSIYCNGDQVVVGIGLNLLGPGFSYLVMTKLWRNRGTSPWVPGLKGIEIPVIKDIPILGPILSGHNPFIYICIGIVVAMHYVLYHTSYGLRIRSVGENPNAVATVGLNVYKLRSSAVLIGGALAGLAGVSLSLGSVNVFTNGMTANKGFLAYAANRFGQWSPAGSYLASILFGSMEALRIRMQSSGIPPQFLQMLPYITTLLALTITGKKLRAPAADGVPYPHPISVAKPKKIKEKKNKKADKNAID